MMHQCTGPTGIAVQVVAPVVGLHDREVHDAIEISRHTGQAAFDQVDADAVHADFF
jgi:hypothetical protein